ncbi:hypothetical protein Sgleb_14410 [Streptomyces glebosus]|uniref:Secreted protein n=1 Tax=Streptomyces glebosus TaxID=249580 RepID=A0A640SRA1_9ACTN|nr:hypothetical protein [Streptomyces glebosus]GFE13394.1 hypothetical protein Sgleb_14410 [Streptomyces glebosus]GHG66139.1 hypothetical protein GCM10010513_34910 [Streptomyces glebosus]
MRMRNVLAGAALGSALVLGGLATPAQAAPATVDSRTTAAAPITTFSIIRVGWYSSLAACEADGENSAYSYWYCRWSSSRGAWGLYVDNDS